MPPAIRLRVGDPGARKGQSTHSTASLNLDRVVLTAVSPEALEEAYPHLPHPPPPQAASDLEITTMVMYGEVWDAFLGSLGGEEVLVKLCGVADYAPIPRIARDGGTSAAHVEQCIAAEMDVYACLGGVEAVPRLWGAFAGLVDGVPVWAVVMENVGREMRAEDLLEVPELE
jgi:hypothetical protein